MRTMVLLALWLVAGARAADEFEREPINYSEATPDNAVTRLQRRIDAGAVTLAYDERRGYLESVLSELRVPVSSQTLVFSKTSLQLRRISPETPRALYFNDEVYVGYCQQGDVVEISATDHRLGAVFYTLDQAEERKPRFARQTENCMLCHASSRTGGVPGHTLRSVFADGRGDMILSEGTIRVDQTTPFADRWGGWYVTGTHGKQPHRGNLITRSRRVERPVENAAGLNVTDLGGRIRRSAYLTGHSDLVALLVLEHQTEAHNLMTRASFTARQAEHQEKVLNREMKLPADHRWDSTGRRIRSAGDELLRYLLFRGEAALAEEVRGSSAFAAEFARKGPRDAKGRSLHDFDLKTRLFRYPCSYLIHSSYFDALPCAVRDHVLRRLWEVLTGRDRSGEFGHLSAADRAAIREILVATKPGLPGYWREGG
ncbi:MAG: hypothetical protein ACRC33_30585 [Gemmataceae bacterium]